MGFSFRTDQELPAITGIWYDNTGAVRDLSSGYTATVKIAPATAPTTVVLTKTSGITLAATAPNWTWSPTTTDWATLITAATTAGVDVPTSAGTIYVLYLYLRRTADSYDAVFSEANLPTFELRTAAA